MKPANTAGKHSNEQPAESRIDLQAAQALDRLSDDEKTKVIDYLSALLTCTGSNASTPKLLAESQRLR